MLEPVSQGLAKIGQTGQWLNVATIDGKQGYVAAWYVSQRPAAGTPSSLYRSLFPNQRTASAMQPAR